MKTHAPFWLFLAVAAASLPGCRAKSALPGAPMGEFTPLPAGPMSQSPFQITAGAKGKNFASGKPIELEIEIKNISPKTVELQFSSGQSFDFSAQREGDKDFVWSYGMNKRFAQKLRTVPLEAAKSLRFETVWNGAEPGSYIISAKITANGGLDAVPFQIVVK